jgi:hypothetical protein
MDLRYSEHEPDSVKIPEQKENITVTWQLSTVKPSNSIHFVISISHNFRCFNLLQYNKRLLAFNENTLYMQKQNVEYESTMVNTCSFNKILTFRIGILEFSLQNKCLLAVLFSMHAVETLSKYISLHKYNKRCSILSLLSQIFVCRKNFVQF